MHHASSRSACQPEPVRAVVRPQHGFGARRLVQLPLLVLLALPAAGQAALAPLLPDGLAFDLHATTLLLALYFGMLLGLIGYNLLLFIALRERSILLYVLFAASFAGAMLGVSGLGNQHLWPPGSAWDSRALPIFITLANICALLFSRSFLDTARQAPRWDHLLTLDIALLLAIALGSPLLPVEPLLQALALVSAGNLLLSLCGLDCMLRRLPAARIFVAAWLLLQCGALLLALRIAGLLPSTPLTDNALLLGSALQMLLLSYALTARLNALKREKSAAQAHSLLALQEQEQILEQRVAERTEALAAANERLRKLAMRDPLTGLANRMALQQHLEQAWQRARRRNELLALILLDLDGFKPVNDCHGHEVGDQLLIEVARRLQASARTTDLVARLGGDEFVLVCESIGSPQQAQALAGRILDTLSQPFRLEQRNIRIGASIGISFGLECGTGNDLLREADQAMYRAKAAGRNCMHLGRQHPEDQPQGAPTPPDEL